MTATDSTTTRASWPLVLPPVVAVALLAVGLRIGAGSPMRGAVLLAAPPPKTLAGLAWQVLVVRENLGVREVLANVPITVRAGDASWSGTTNGDGVAEAALARPDLAARPAFEVVVTANDDGATLARGVVTVPAAWSAPSPPARAGAARTVGGRALRPARRDGAIAIDVVLRDGVLVAGHPEEVWVHTSDASSGASVLGADVVPEPDPGLAFGAAHATTCDDGWASIDATAEMHVAATGLEVKTHDGRSGAWYGSLPVARGAAWVALAPSIPAGARWSADFVLPGEGRTGYVEIDDAQGRAFAATFVSGLGRAGPPHALVAMPPLGAGLYWLVTSGAPRGAESLADLSTTVARPFLVLGAPADPCVQIGELARAEPPVFAREAALDGLVPARARALERRSRGRRIALWAVGLSAALETAMIVARARRARARVFWILVGLSVVLLGFALLALLAIV